MIRIILIFREVLILRLFSAGGGILFILTMCGGGLLQRQRFGCGVQWHLEYDERRSYHVDQSLRILLHYIQHDRLDF